MVRCKDCKEIDDRTCPVEEKDKQICKVCGGKMEMLVEKEPQVIFYRERPAVREWRREKGV